MSRWPCGRGGDVPDRSATGAIRDRALADLGLASEDAADSSSLPRWCPKQARGWHSPALAQRTMSTRTCSGARDTRSAMAKEASPGQRRALSRLVQGRRLGPPDGRGCFDAEGGVSQARRAQSARFECAAWAQLYHSGGRSRHFRSVPPASASASRCQRRDRTSDSRARLVHPSVTRLASSKSVRPRIALRSTTRAATGRRRTASSA
jgi:hypothetical protein